MPDQERLQTSSTSRTGEKTSSDRGHLHEWMLHAIREALLRGEQRGATLSSTKKLEVVPVVPRSLLLSDHPSSSQLGKWFFEPAHERESGMLESFEALVAHLGSASTPVVGPTLLVSHAKAHSPEVGLVADFGNPRVFVSLTKSETLLADAPAFCRALGDLAVSTAWHGDRHFFPAGERHFLPTSVETAEELESRKAVESQIRLVERSRTRTEAFEHADFLADLLEESDSLASQHELASFLRDSGRQHRDVVLSALADREVHIGSEDLLRAIIGVYKADDAQLSRRAALALQSGGPKASHWLKESGSPDPATQRLLRLTEKGR